SIYHWLMVIMVPRIGRWESVGNKIIATRSAVLAIPLKRLNTRSLFWFLDAIGCSLQLVETQTAADLQQRFSRDWEIRPERYSSSDARHEPIRRVISRKFPSENRAPGQHCLCQEMSCGAHPKTED